MWEDSSIEMMFDVTNSKGNASTNPSAFGGNDFKITVNCDGYVLDQFDGYMNASWNATYSYGPVATILKKGPPVSKSLWTMNVSIPFAQMPAQYSAAPVGLTWGYARLR